MNVRAKTVRVAFLSVISSASLLLGVGAANATASTWLMHSTSNTTVAPGGTLEYQVEATNPVRSQTAGPIELTATLPPGSDATEAVLSGPTAPRTPCALESSTSVKCETEATLEPFGCCLSFQNYALLSLKAVVPSAEERITAHFAVSGGGLSPAETVDSTIVTSEPPKFGIDNFDSSVLETDGSLSTKAGGHPTLVETSIDFNMTTSERGGPRFPVEPVKDAVVDLPPGQVGNPTIMATCTATELGNGPGIEAQPGCPAASQVGTVTLHLDIGSTVPPIQVGPLSLYNMVAPPGVPARFGFNALGSLVTFNASVRSSSDYGLSVESADMIEALAITGSTIDFWGAPASDTHTGERGCPNLDQPALGGPPCAAEIPVAAFFRNPTSCSGPQATGARIDSWFNPGVFVETTSLSHQAPGYPHDPSEWGAGQGIEGCETVPFEPTFSTQPATAQADSPSGLEVDLTVPQGCWQAGEVETTCQSDLKDAKVTLPAGMTLNPSSADGLAACTPEEIGLTTPVRQSSPVHFDEAPAACPDASKIGTVSIETPLLAEPLTGAVYLARQGDNPFGSLLAMYLVAKGSGVTIKQAGKIEADPRTGQLSTIFSDAPQLPFNDLHLRLFPGPRAVLRTPPTCGTYATEAKLTPWARPTEPVSKESSFQITSCPNSGFSPKLQAGTENPLAGHTSSFLLRLSREDGEGELSNVSATLPPGLSGYLRGIPYCPDSALASVSGAEGTGQAQEANPSCPAQSRVGAVTVGAGAGPNPFYTQKGRVYLAGPYKGAPLSLAVIAPAVAGPFDLGSVVVRNALQINPETAQITAVSDPLPSILHGVPLDLRDVRVELNRPDFTLNPTSCEAMQIASQITSTQGQSANPAQRFQAADCNRLAFKPKLKLTLKGSHSRRAHPALRAVLTMPASHQANIARAQVTLPHAEFLDQGHIRNVCTQAQFKGAGCPASSVLGHAKTYSPLLDNPLEGPVYLMSGFGHKLPDLAADLNGQIRVLLHGKVDTGSNGGIRTTFEVVPDAPVTKFTISLKGGRRGLIQNSEDVCAHPGHAIASFNAHNGKIHDTEPPIATGCAKHGRSHHKRHH